MLISDLIAEAARVFYITQEELTGKSRKHIYTKARFALMKALHIRGWSTNKIGKQLAKDHTTVMHGLDRAEEYMLTDVRFRMRVQYLAYMDQGEELSPVAGPDDDEVKRLHKVEALRELMLDVLDTSDIPSREDPLKKTSNKAPRGWGAERWVRAYDSERASPEASRKLLERILATGKVWKPASVAA